LVLGNRDFRANFQGNHRDCLRLRAGDRSVYRWPLLLPFRARS
jgi:hypothetical protein